MVVLFVMPYVFFFRIVSPIPVFILLLPILVCFRRPIDIPLLKKTLASTTDLLLILAFLALVSILLAIFHKSHDWYMTQFWFLRVAFVFYWAALVYFEPRLMKLDYIVPILGCAFFLHALTSWILYFAPELRNTVLEFTYISNLAQNSLAYADFNSRLPSVGVMFFGGGVFYAVTIFILIVYAIEKETVIWPWILSVFLFVTAIHIARTAYLILPLIIPFLLYRNSKENLKRFLLAFFSTACLIALLNSNLRTQKLTNFSLEPFYNLLHSGKPTAITASTVVMINDTKLAQRRLMHKSTLAFGDGKTLSEHGYYGGSDIGYIRLILYGGILYSIIYFLPLLYSVILKRNSFKKMPHVTILFGILLASILFNVKGMIDAAALYIPIMISLNLESRS